MSAPQRVISCLLALSLAAACAVNPATGDHEIGSSNTVEERRDPDSLQLTTPSQLARHRIGIRAFLDINPDKGQQRERQPRQ